MSARTPEERSLVARIAAAERWGRTPDRTTATAAARNGLRAKFEREADPNGALTADERGRRADSLMRAHMLRMSLAAKSARRRAGESAAVAEAAEAALRDAGDAA